MNTARNVTGSNYQATRHLDLAQVAKLIRADIKEARADPGSPVPPDAKIRVRIERYSMGQSIDVTLDAMPDTWTYVAPGTGPDYGNVYPTNGGYSGQCQAAIDAVRGIVESYNRDNSEPMTDYSDVKFFGWVDVRDERSQRFEAARKARKAARSR